MKHEIDARGLACPQPVVLADKKLKESDYIEILVDNETACENLKRFAANSGCSYESIASGDHFKIIIKRTGAAATSASDPLNGSQGNTGSVVVFASDKMGSGDDELGTLLMKAFINTLSANDIPPSELVFYNSGVKLTAEGSGVTDDLRLLQEKKVKIIICGTCVNYYNIRENIKVGSISNMFEILETMNKAVRIIKP